MNLYKITVTFGHFSDHHEEIFVLAENEMEASKLTLAKWKKWKYSNDVYVEVITLIAQEGQYGKPKTFINQRTIQGGNDD